MLLSWFYFRRYQVNRPPIGVFNLRDMLIMFVFIILIPFFYLVLPLWVAAGLLLLAAMSIFYMTWEAVLPARWLVWLVVLGLVGLDLGASAWFGTTNNWFFLVNNCVLVLLIVGLTNLWAQSGMKARDAAILGGLLVIYDFIATTQLPLMTDLLHRLSGLPFAPTLAWSSGNIGLGIGLGDMLMATVFPLVLRKAFGRTAGITALVIMLGAMVILFALPFQVVFPAMVVFGPLMGLQYLYWKYQRGSERTTWQYLQSEL